MGSENQCARYCVIGAGAAGLAVAKNFREHGIDFEVIERHAEVGGLWGYGRPFSAVYKSTRLISSKPMTQFRDFPMDADLPDYPGQEAVLAYMKQYADRFHLRENIRFGSEVESTSRCGSQWEVRLRSGEVRRYRGLVLASGVTWDAITPQLPGHFDGKSLHSLDYKIPERFAGQNVLVIGGGNSGCDIAADLAPHARKTFLSMRRGYHFIPRYVFGIPSDQFGEASIKLGVPIRVRQILNQWMVRCLLGDPVKLGLMKPNHRMFESHPIVNAEVLDEIKGGRVFAKPDVQELSGNIVRFADGSEEAIDSIIYATGYRISYPYLDPSHLAGAPGRPDFYLHLFHRQYDNLFIVGMIQPASGVWGLMDDQARLIARYLCANADNTRSAERFNRQKTGPQPNLTGGLRYIESERHFTEVDHSSYRKVLQNHLTALDSD